MAETSGFFPSINGDRKYKADWLAKYIHSFIANGVYNNELAVLETESMKVKVSKGRAWINGYFYENDDEYMLDIENADGVLNRIDSIVLQFNINERAMNLKILKGAYAQHPQAPALTRNVEVYELKLADITIFKGTTHISQASIQDTRLDNTVCGLVHNPIDQIDTHTLYLQIQADLAEFKNVSEENFLTWFLQIKEMWETQKLTFEEVIVKSEQAAEDMIAEGQQTFDQFMSGIQGILNEDALGHLLGLITANTPVGEIKQYAGDIAPNGYLLCQGQEISREDYAELFSVISDKFGSGDGSTTFNLPDFRGRTMVGVDGSDIDFAAVGNTGGKKTHRLSIDEMPVHTHTQTGHTHTASGAVASAGAHVHSASSASAGAHTHSVSGSAATAGAHEHSVQVRGVGRKAGLTGGGYGYFMQNSGPNSASPDANDLYAYPAGAHTHTISGTAASAGGHAHTVSVASNGAHTHGVTVSLDETVGVNGTAGGGLAHNNMQPYVTINYIIKY